MKQVGYRNLKARAILGYSSKEEFENAIWIKAVCHRRQEAGSGGTLGQSRGHELRKRVKYLYEINFASLRALDQLDMGGGIFKGADRVVTVKDKDS